MRVLGLVTLVALSTVSASYAGDPHLIQGLTCRTEAQVENVIAFIQRDIPPAVAAEMLNEEDVDCVFVDRIWYMIDGPIIIGSDHHRGLPLVKYEGTLVGVLVGENPRPIEPALRIFFLLPERLQGVPEAHGA